MRNENADPGRKRKKRIIAAVIAAVIVLCAVGAVWLYWLLRDHSAERRLLQAVGIMPETPYSAVDRVYWNDYLRYTSGYEVLVVSIAPEDWPDPPGWEPGTVTLDGFSADHNICIVEYALKNLDCDLLPETYSVSFFSEEGRDSGSIYDWEFHAGFYDGEGTLLIYRGLNMYGDTWRMYADSWEEYLEILEKDEGIQKWIEVFD